jgi:hypothetical protein
MVLMKLRPAPPEQRQATITASVSLASPSLSISSLKSNSDEAKNFSLDIHLRCTSSTSPSKPLTICTVGTAFDNTHAGGESHLDNLARGIVPGGFISTSDPSRNISLGNFRVNEGGRDERNKAPNLLDRPYLEGRFITVPSLDSGEDVVVRHPLPPERLFHYSERVKLEDLKPGEKYKITVSEQWIGSMWWCWGELDKGKKYSGWEKPDGGYFDDATKPPEDEIERGEWVLGEDPSELYFEFDGGGKAEVEFAE